VGSTRVIWQIDSFKKIKISGKIFFHSYLHIHSRKSPKNSTLLAPGIPQFSNPDLEKLLLKNNLDNREHVLGVKVGFLGFEIWTQEWFYNKSGKVTFQSGEITGLKMFVTLAHISSKIFWSNLGTRNFPNLKQSNWKIIENPNTMRSKKRREELLFYDFIPAWEVNLKPFLFIQSKKLIFLIKLKKELPFPSGIEPLALLLKLPNFCEKYLFL